MVLAVVLAVSAAITTVAPPVAANQSLPFPPTPSGATIGLGTRAGFIGLGLTASTGQLVVRLSVPETSDGGGDAGGGGVNGTAAGNQFDLKLAGDVGPNPATNPAPEPLALAFRRCGYGCFVAPITWRPGTVTVTLNATAKGWAGGTAALDMTWPPIGAAADLSRLVRRMRDVAVIVLHERVTSNTNTGLGRARTLHLAGRRFVQAEPYASGRATSVTLKSPPAVERVLALAYPSEGIYVLLLVGVDGRIRQERLTTPTGLITRTFVYPSKEGPRLPESGGQPIKP